MRSKRERFLRCLTAAVCIASICLTVGCGADEIPSGAITETSASTIPESEETTAMTVPTEPVDLSKGITDDMYKRAVINVGDRSRLAEKIRILKSGGTIKLGYIGGSITQGSLASSSDNCYAMLNVCGWAENIGENVEYINAGIGATDSYTGVHRMQKDLLGKKPDVVVVEFSVNDTNPVVNKKSYDSLIRGILSQDNAPAVILLFMTMEDGTSLQDTHKEIGLAYDLPMISYHEAIMPEVNAGTIVWSDISPDNIHPNDIGHMMTAQLLDRFIVETADNLDSIAAPAESFDITSPTGDIYAGASILSYDDIKPIECDGFAEDEKMQQFGKCWSTTDGGKLTFEVEARNIGILFYRTTDGKSGKYDILIDGEKKASIDGDFTGGWGNYAQTKEVMRGKEKQPHTVTIIPSDGEENTCMSILGLMIS